MPRSLRKRTKRSQERQGTTLKSGTIYCSETFVVVLIVLVRYQITLGHQEQTINALDSLPIIMNFVLIVHMRNTCVAGISIQLLCPRTRNASDSYSSSARRSYRNILRSDDGQQKQNLGIAQFLMICEGLDCTPQSNLFGRRLKRI